ncbi:MAG: hypothetical protein JWR32_3298 [Mycobacterium sp.]|nr:hypothetical protein [Mycobacterium sp.]
MSHTVRSRCATAAVISSGLVCHSCVEPSTSAKTNVTVPIGSSSFTLSSLQFPSGIFARGSVSLMLASVRPPRAEKSAELRTDGRSAGRRAKRSRGTWGRRRAAGLPGMNASVPFAHAVGSR